MKRQSASGANDTAVRGQALRVSGRPADQDANASAARTVEPVR